EFASAIVVLLSIRVGRIIGAFIVELMDENTAATGLLQVRHGGGGDQGSLLPRSMRLDVPKFSGVDPESWLFSIYEYFTLLNTPIDQRLRIVGFNLDGAAAEWFRWMTRNGLITDWPRVSLVSKPTTLGDAFALARVTEARLEDQGTVSVATKVASTSGGSQYQRATAGVKTPLLPTPPKANVNPNAKPLAINCISPAERQERLNTGEDLTMEEDEAVETGDISILNSLVTLHIQGLDMEVDLYVLPMQGLDVVLGIQWLQKLGKVMHDYAQQVMEFTLLGAKYMLKGDESLCINKISLHRMQALFEMDEVYGVYECHGFALGDKDDRGVATSPTLSGQPELDQLLARYDSLFQIPTCLPPSRVVDHRIHLFPNTKLVKVRPYRYPHYQKDYFALNSITVKDKFPIPTADEMVDELGGASVFNNLELRAGYHQIRVRERDVYKAAFRTHNGHYEFLVMLFGLTNASSTTTLRLHLEHLECVFHCLQKHQFYVKRSKCVFGFEELEYLGHIISAQGYYRRFIQGFASLAAPLTDLLKHEGFKWVEADIRAFKDLKERLSNAPLLSLPNFNREFVIEADASGDGIGAVLMQENRPISYFSHKLGPRMRVAATYQKELFAIVEAVYKWRQYLLGRRFTIRTDHKSIKELMQQVVQTLLQQKYVRKLMGFDFSIEYKTGSANRAADALSRVFEEDEQLSASFMDFIKPLVGLVGELRESKLKPLLLQEFHATPSAGHGGIKKILVRLSALFFWKGMRKPVEEFVKKSVWEDVSMDFITGFPSSKGSTVIIVVVDRLTKYVHFGALPTNFNALKVAEIFLDIAVKHHGIPKTIVSDRDPIFTDGQTKVVNRCLEQYLRAMVANRPQQWVRFLPWAEYWYNSSYHSSIKMSPFQALYGRLPLFVIPYPLGSSKVATVDELLVERDRLLRQLKESLLTAKHQMEVKANRKRRDIEFKVEARVGKVAYHLALPASSKIHSVFHVSILKAFVGSDGVEVAELPEELQDGQPVEHPLTICDTRRVLRNGSPKGQVLVQWMGGSPEEAT
ncbi:ty3-gypsy retrotransposon protein, partial [Tanacetum coccineum]